MWQSWICKAGKYATDCITSNILVAILIDLPLEVWPWYWSPSAVWPVKLDSNNNFFLFWTFLWFVFLWSSCYIINNKLTTKIPKFNSHLWIAHKIQKFPDWTVASSSISHDMNHCYVQTPYLHSSCWNKCGMEANNICQDLLLEPSFPSHVFMMSEIIWNVIT